MAVLAAYDIVDLYPWKSVSVYTVGAPRPGNQAFADKYDAKVPDTWHIINPSVRPNSPCQTMHMLLRCWPHNPLVMIQVA